MFCDSSLELLNSNANVGCRGEHCSPEGFTEVRKQKMNMVRHDDVIVNLYFWVMLCNKVNFFVYNYSCLG